MLPRSPARPFAYQGGVVALAHRGFRGAYPENTMLAFTKAAELPIDGLEMDIHSTRDGALVVCHDPSVDRTTDGSGPIQSFTLSELKRLDAGYRFTKDDGHSYPFRGQGVTIPTVAEVFEHFPNLWLNVDIKQTEPDITESFCRLIRQYDVVENLCVGSFANDTVGRFRRLCPEVVRVGSLGEVLRLYLLDKLRLSPLFWGKAHTFQLPEYERNLKVVTPRFLHSAQRNNIAVHIWTVNDQDEMTRFIHMGADGIITDYPDRLLQLLGRI